MQYLLRGESKMGDAMTRQPTDGKDGDGSEMHIQKHV
jgi:hypothetical protein